MGAEVDEHRRVDAQALSQHHLPGPWAPTAGSKPFSPPWGEPAPASPTATNGAASRSRSHISSPPKSRRSQRAPQRLQEHSGQEDRGPWPCSSLDPSSGHSAVPVARLCLTPPSHQAYLDRLKGEDAVLPGVEDLQDGG